MTRPRDVQPAAAPVNAPGPHADEAFAPAKKPDAPEPPHWRVGTQVGRTVYDGPKGSGHLIGVMDTPELARRVVDAVNASPAATVPSAPVWGLHDDELRSMVEQIKEHGHAVVHLWDSLAIAAAVEELAALRSLIHRGGGK
jgi:hypothetical protein